MKYPLPNHFDLMGSSFGLFTLRLKATCRKALNKLVEDTCRMSF